MCAIFLVLFLGNWNSGPVVRRGNFRPFRGAPAHLKTFAVTLSLDPDLRRCCCSVEWIKCSGVHWTPRQQGPNGRRKCQRQCDHSQQHRQRKFHNGLTHSGQLRQSYFYGAVIHIDLWYRINHGVSRHEIDKKMSSQCSIAVKRHHKHGKSYNRKHLHGSCLAHYHHGRNHGSMQADMVLEKMLGVLHSDPQAAGRVRAKLAWSFI